MKQTAEYLSFEIRKQSVISLLKSSGPLSIDQIAEAQKTTVKQARDLIMRIRWESDDVHVSGFIREGLQITKQYSFGPEPDAEYVTVNKRRADSDEEQESHDEKRRRALLEQIKPFRDPYVFMTAGRAP